MKVPRARFPSWLRPGAVGWILFPLLIALQACLVSTRGTGEVGFGGEYEMTLTRSFGWPTSVVITSRTGEDGESRTKVDVRWLPLLLATVATYGVAMATGHLVMRRRRRRHPAKVLLAAVGGTLVLAFVAAAVVSKSLWGYYLYRPALDGRIAGAKKVVSVTMVKTDNGAGGERVLVPDDSYSIAQTIEYARTNPYYSLGERALDALEKSRRLPASPPGMEAGRLAGLYRVLAGTGRLEDGEPGYDRAKDLRGVVIEAMGPDGAPIVFVGVQGGEVSNDHHPYYEFLFAGPVTSGAPRLLSSQRFYFDVAGIEGMEWPSFFLVFSAMGLILAVPATLLAMIVRPRRAEAGSGPPEGTAPG